MHDLRWIRENPEEFDRGLARRFLPPRAAEVLALDREWRALETAAQESQATRNRLSREIGAAKARGEPVDEVLRQIQERKDSEAATAAKAAELRRQLDEALAGLPNLPALDVPDGPDETANRELRRVGEPPSFAFSTADARGDRRQARADGFRPRRQPVGFALCRAARRAGAARTGDRAVHARPAHWRVRLHRNRAAAIWCATRSCTAPANCRKRPRTCSRPARGCG